MIEELTKDLAIKKQKMKEEEINRVREMDPEELNKYLCNLQKNDPNFPIFKKGTDPTDYLNNVVEYQHKNETLYEDLYLQTQFIKLIKNDEQLIEFLKDPNTFASKNNLSLADVYVLQSVCKDNEIKNKYILKNPKLSPHFDERKLSNFFIQAMIPLALEQFAVSDATRFRHCIKEGMEDTVLLSTQGIRSSMPIGMSGVVSPKTGQYTRALIARTANVVNDPARKAGECHTFAQLAADHLLNQMENKKIVPPINVKIVTHEAKPKINSHTFVLLGHEGTDFSDLSKCLIVDPWAYGLGYRDTNGIFTQYDYPYSGMLKNLKCVYDSSKDSVHQSSVTRQQTRTKAATITTTTTQPQETTSGAAREQASSTKKLKKKTRPKTTSNESGFFKTISSTVTKPPEVTKNQVLDFIDECSDKMTRSSKMFGHKYSLIQAIKNDLNSGIINPEDALIKIIDIIFTPRNKVKHDSGNFSWEREPSEFNTQSGRALPSILNTTNNNPIRKYLNYQTARDKQGNEVIRDTQLEDFSKLINDYYSENKVSREYTSPKKGITMLPDKT